MTVQFRAKDFFFDRAGVMSQLNKTERQGLSRIGAYIRTSARSSLRRRKRSSRPGETPSIHSRDKVANLKHILFFYEASRHTVVVGPVKLNQRNFRLKGRGKAGNWVTIPALMEAGGTLAIREKSTDGGLNWRRQNQRRSPRERELFRTRRAKYSPRPFMGPAMKKALPKLPSIFTARAA